MSIRKEPPKFKSEYNSLFRAQKKYQLDKKKLIIVSFLVVGSKALNLATRRFTTLRYFFSGKKSPMGVVCILIAHKKGGGIYLYFLKWIKPSLNAEALLGARLLLLKRNARPVGIALGHFH
jgi:hypothetical protein